MSGLFFRAVLSVATVWFRYMAMLLLYFPLSFSLLFQWHLLLLLLLLLLLQVVSNL
jgi:hypothetical protein